MRRSVSDSGEEIEVVHRKRHPKLHGILKTQHSYRTVSESSDDACVSRQTSTGNESTSPTLSEGDGYWAEQGSGEEAGERKKSVSFSERIDSTTFNRNQSVSSMREALRNKRKRQRKQQRRRQQEQQVLVQGRRRRNSNSISEVSSDEASNATADVQASADSTSEDAQPEVKTSETQQNGVARVEDVKVAVVKETSNGTSDQTNGNKHTNGNINDRMADDDDSDDVEGEAEEVEEADIVNGREVTHAQQQESHEQQEKPETMLSWNERPIANELKPKCAVELSNDVMFDLDVD